jgi:hypothetical protein
MSSPKKDLEDQLEVALMQHLESHRSSLLQSDPNVSERGPVAAAGEVGISSHLEEGMIWDPALAHLLMPALHAYEHVSLKAMRGSSMLIFNFCTNRQNFHEFLHVVLHSGAVVLKCLA